MVYSVMAIFIKALSQFISYDKLRQLLVLIACFYHDYFKVVNIKLGFTDLLICNLITLIEQCKIHYLNLDKALLFPRNQTICLKNWRLRRAPTTKKFIIFCWNFAHVSHLSMSTKGCSGFFLCFLDPELLMNQVSVSV